MTSLITGNRGFVGGHLEDYLRAKNIKTVGFDMLSDYPTVEVLTDFMKSNDVTEIYHLGARPFIPDCYGMEIGAVVQSNIVFTANLLMATMKTRVKRMVYLSTSEVYGNVNMLPINEDTPTNPVSTYAATKLASENLIKSFRDETGLSASILRHFNIYGPRDTHPRIIPKLMSAAKHDTVVHLGNIDVSRDFSYVSDVCESLYNVMSLYGKEDFVKGNDWEWSISELIDGISDLYGRKIKYVTDNQLKRPNDVLRLRADSSKYRRHFPSHESISIYEGLKLTKDWYDNNYWRWEYDTH